MKKNNQYKLHIVSLGCPKNLIDSEVMGGLVAQAGAQIVDRIENADIVLINTCAFIKAAKEEALEEILTLAEEKKKGRLEFRLVVAGCLAQRYGDELSDQIPEVDLFIGTGEVGNIVRHLEKLTRKPAGKSVISEPDFLMTAKQPRLLPSKTVSAYLKISDGCSNRCAYCAIPSIRGVARSRKPEDILEEAESLVARGIREIIIIGQDTTAYGRDLKSRPHLSDLLNNLAKIRKLKWLRLLYAHPAHIATDVLEIIAANKTICPYIDLPVQHIDDNILSAMNRKVTGARIFEIITQARRIIPDVAIRTSLIVGFPGETKKIFERLLDFINEAKFDHLGVFTYSREEGTAAYDLISRISEREKERRREALMNEQAAISQAVNQKLLGSLQEVLVEEKSDRPDYNFVGRCRRQAPEIDGKTYIKTQNGRIGSFLRCRIIAADEYDLFAQSVD